MGGGGAPPPKPQEAMAASLEAQRAHGLTWKAVLKRAVAVTNLASYWLSLFVGPIAYALYRRGFGARRQGPQVAATPQPG